MSFTFTGLPFLSSFSTSTNTHSFLYFCFISFMCIFPTIAIDIFVDLKTFCKCGVVIFGLFLILPRVFTFPEDFHPAFLFSQGFFLFAKEKRLIQSCTH